MVSILEVIAVILVNNGVAFLYCFFFSLLDFVFDAVVGRNNAKLGTTVELVANFLLSEIKDYSAGIVFYLP